jgi:hypothetical protein
LTGEPTPGQEPRRSAPAASGDIGGDSEGGDLGGETSVLVGDDDMAALLVR